MQFFLEFFLKCDNSNNYPKKKNNFIYFLTTFRKISVSRIVDYIYIYYVNICLHNILKQVLLLQQLLYFLILKTKKKEISILGKPYFLKTTFCKLLLLASKIFER